MAITDEKYMLFTTFRRDGTPVSSPVWIVSLEGDTFGFWTSTGSGKAKRLAHTERVIVQPSDGRGRVRAGSAPIDATARIVTGPELEVIRHKVVAKYGVMTKFAKYIGQLVGTLRGKRLPYGDCGVVVTPTT